MVGTRLYFDGGTYGGLYGLSTLDGAQLFFNNQLEQYDQWSPLSFGGKVYTFIAGKLRAHDPVTGGIQTSASSSVEMQSDFFAPASARLARRAQSPSETATNAASAKTQPTWAWAKKDPTRRAAGR